MTPEIPNVGEDATRDLDENGIIRIGARVSEEIFDWESHPKGETDPSPKKNCYVLFLAKRLAKLKMLLGGQSWIKGVVIKTQLLLSKQKEQKEEREQILLFQKEASEKKSHLKSSRDEKLLIY